MIFVDNSSHDLYFFGLGLEADEATREQALQLSNALTVHYHQVNVMGVY